MRNQTPLAPGAANGTVYLALGRAYCETDEADANEATVIENLLSGQNSHPLRVVASISPRDGRVMSPRTLLVPR